MTDSFYFGGLGLLFSVMPIALIVLAIVAIAAGRREPDPTGARLYLFYLTAATFVALFVVLFSLFATTSALARAFFDRGGFDRIERLRPDSFDEIEGYGSAVPTEVESHGSAVATEIETDPEFVLSQSGLYGGGSQVREALQPAIVAALGGLVLYFHSRRLRDVTEAPEFAAGGSFRTFLVYLYAVCFTTLLVGLGAAAVALYAVIRAAFPGSDALPGAVERDRAWIDLMSSGILAVASAGVFAYHWRRAEALRGA